MAKHVVARVDDLPLGATKVVEVAGRSIGLFNIDGEVFALNNRCPHQGGPLCEGRRFGRLTAERPGEYVHDRPGEYIRCPWHGWEFDIKTGQSWFDPRKVRVRDYDVEIRKASELEAGEDLGEGPEGWVKGPYQADTIPVSVEDELILVDLGSRRTRA